MNPRAASAPLLVTMGDPAGVGPEIIVSAVMAHPGLLDDIVVAGDVATLKRATRVMASSARMKVPDIVAVSGPDGRPGAGVLAVWQACETHEPVTWGRAGPVAGRAAAQCIESAAGAVLENRARALVTAPIHKEALAMAGVPFPGHTEMLQSLAARHMGCTEGELPVRMMLSEPRLRTVLVSIHVALADAIAMVTQAQVLQTIEITHRHFQLTGMQRPRIAVAGLNPHAGEGGLFGREEILAIAPAVEQARKSGIDVTGPYPPDTVFMQARKGAFDVVIAMYHDQGLIAVKLLGIEHGVNTTLGLPFVRTSPDHGTAFDLAGQGVASPDSLLAAIEAARSAASAPA